jgi:hypothetical protein
MNEKAADVYACADSGGEPRIQLVAETGGRNGGVRERWVKPGRDAICRFAAGINVSVQREAGMAAVA